MVKQVLSFARGMEGKRTTLQVRHLLSEIRQIAFHEHSDVGQGTQFKVCLPAVSGTETQQAEDIELPLGNGELILVVDD